MQDYNRDFNNILKCLSNNNEKIECLCEDKEILISLVPLLSIIKPTKKRPDAIAEKGQILLLLEHFQFDNSGLNKKGSLQNQITAKTDRELTKLLEKNKKFAAIHETVKKSGVNYVENFQKQFNSHVKNIDKYKLEIQGDTKRKYAKWITGFVIEDSSPFGSAYWNNNEVKYVNLLYSKEFLDLFEKATQLDFVIFAMTENEENKKTSFISRKAISLHRQTQIEVSKISEFLFEDSIYFSSQIFISCK